MTPDELKAVIHDAIKEAVAQHHACVFNEQERSLIRDFIDVGRQVKKTFIWTIAGLITFSVGYVLYTLGLRQAP